MRIDVVKEVRKLGFSFGQYTVVGTGIMAVLGIKDTDDADLVVLPSLFERLKQSGEWEEFKKPNGGPALRKGNVEAYLDVNCGSHNPTSEELISRAVVIQGIPFITLEELLKFKKEYKRPKDFTHIEIIEEFEKERGVTMGQEYQQLHIHPERNTIFGIRLQPGCVLKETDVYASSNGTWEKCPCPGVTLRKTDVVWVRPTMEV